MMENIVCPKVLKGTQQYGKIFIVIIIVVVNISISNNDYIIQSFKTAG
jgi:hypothetical protein